MTAVNLLISRGLSEGNENKTRHGDGTVPHRFLDRHIIIPTDTLREPYLHFMVSCFSFAVGIESGAQVSGLVASMVLA